MINRGNYSDDVFESAGAAEAFLKTLWEAARRYGWKIHAYAIMRNHYHLALETPLPNLSAGMHWLQGTFASRFNRFRKQSGRLFQGPYKALPIEDMAQLCRVVDYIHLNPVRARVVRPGQVARYEWSSLSLLRSKSKAGRPSELCASEWLAARGGWKDTPKGTGAYEQYLAQIGGNEEEQKNWACKSYPEGGRWERTDESRRWPANMPSVGWWEGRVWARMNSRKSGRLAMKTNSPRR